MKMVGRMGYSARWRISRVSSILDFLASRVALTLSFIEIAHAILILYIKLCPPSANSSTTNPTTNLSSYPSPAFSPYSPSSHALHASSSTAGANGTQGARDKLLWNTGVPHTLSGRSAEIIEAGKSIEGLTEIKIRLREVEGRRRGSLGGDVASASTSIVEVARGAKEGDVVGDVSMDSPSTETEPSTPSKSLKRSSSSSALRQSTNSSNPTIAPRKRSKPERWIGAAAALEEKALAAKAKEGVNGSGSVSRGSKNGGGRDREREAKEREELSNGSVRYRF